MQSSAQLAHVQKRLNELQASLAATSATLDQRTRELRTKDQECQSLQMELDETLNIVMHLFAEERQSRDAGPGEAGAGRSGLEEPQTELQKLREELRKAELLEQEQGRQLEELRAGLMSAEAEIAEIQMATEQEITALLAVKEGLATVAAQSLIRTGKPSVPSLTRLLSDDRAEVRAWAAYVLGEIGQDAEEASTVLISLLSDPNQDVRDQSQQALNKIAPLGQR